MAEFITTEQALAPVQAPPQPTKLKPALGAGVRATVVPDGNEEAQVGPQLMPAGELVTVPLPELTTLSGNGEAMESDVVVDVPGAPVPLGVNWVY